MIENRPSRMVAVVGGGVAGAEAAFQLFQRGIRVVLFDPDLLPYGKLEEGLPKWHYKLRDREEEKIDRKLQQAGVDFVPGVKLGREIQLTELVEDWGFSAVLLAVGAWRDRPLPVPGIEKFRGKGLCYQNEFVAWFNHNHEPGGWMPHCEARDGAVVIGGGLASLDVVKILMLETVLAALQRRGHRELNLFTLEQRGIPAVLEELGFTLRDLGVKGCTLYYRRRVEDMPLTPPPAKATLENLRKIAALRRRIFENFQRKYCFAVQENRVPVDFLAENDRLVGMVFQESAGVEGKVQHPSGRRETVKTPLVVSSIGSIPEPLPGVPLEGELYRFANPEMGQIAGYENVFALGNAVTGRGNIRDSLLHSRKTVRKIAEDFLESREEDYQEWLRQQEKKVDQHLEQISLFLNTRRALTPEILSRIERKVSELQARVGYEGDYQSWVNRHKPPRLETLLGISNEPVTGDAGVC